MGIRQETRACTTHNLELMSGTHMMMSNRENEGHDF